MSFQQHFNSLISEARKKEYLGAGFKDATLEDATKVVIKLKNTKKDLANAELINKITSSLAKAKKINDEVRSLKEEVREKIEPLFDEADKSFERIVRIGNNAILLGKHKDRIAPPKMADFVKKLVELMPDYEKQITDTLEAMTQHFPVDPSIKSKQFEEGVSDIPKKVWNKIINVVTTTVEKIKRMRNVSDKKLDSLEKEMKQAGIDV